MVLDEWPAQFNAEAKRFTTVMTWDAYGSVRYKAQTYRSKGKEFLKFVQVPSKTPQELEVAIGEAPVKTLTANGWHLRNSVTVTRTLDSYRRYIQSSRGEFSIAKNGYVQSHCGWFSDRSAVYLASGKPVVLQETGFSRWLPVGKGLLSFSDPAEAANALEHINRDYRSHCIAARGIAEEYFESGKVLRPLMAAL